KTLLLFLVGNVEEEFADDCSIARQVALEAADVLKALVPKIFGDDLLGQFLPRKKLRVHAHDKRLLVVAAVENTDAAALRQRLYAPPEKIMIEILSRRRFEGRYLAPLRIDPGHDMFDSAVLSGRVHRQEDDQERQAVLRVESVLQLRQGLHAGLQCFLRPLPVFGFEFAGVARVYVRELELLAVLDAIRF